MKDIEAVPLMQEPKENAVKDTKKLVEAFSSVFRHQHGQEPTQEDITKFLAGQAEKEQQPDAYDNSPSILKYKVITGKSNKPLYFCDGEKWFDCDSEQWMDKVPAVASELNERPITTADLYYAIMHGLVDDTAYQQLNEKSLVPQESQKLYEKLQKLNQTVEELKMSQESLEKAIYEDEKKYSSGEPEFVSENSSNEEMNYTQDTEEAMNEFEMIEQGTNVVAEVLRIALEDGLAPELEEAIRRIVREELLALQQPRAPMASQELHPLSDEEINKLGI